jgi:hypothetical protein
MSDDHERAALRAAANTLRAYAREKKKTVPQLMDSPPDSVIAILRAAKSVEAIPESTADVMHVVASALWAITNDVDESEVSPQCAGASGFMAFAAAALILNSISNVRYAIEAFADGFVSDPSTADSCEAEILRNKDLFEP